MNSTDVIVGIDGSPRSDTALHWAAAEAARSGARLRVVLVYRRGPVAALVATQRVEQLARDEAEIAVGAAAESAGRRQPGIAVSGHAVFGDAAEVLTNLAFDAGMVVVGSRRHTALSAAVLGGVGTRVAAHAEGCVAVVRGRTDDTTHPVVVGVDGSPADDHLLEIAFEQAARRGCGLVAVRAFASPAPPWGVGVPPLAYNHVRARTTLHDELTEDVRRWHDKYPGVPAEIRMPGGDPASALLDASHEAQLLVVGGRGYGGAAGLLLGSVSQRLQHHADCPLLIVRTASRLAVRG